VTGIEDDQIGILGTRNFDKPGRRQGVCHTMRIVDVHLAAKGFDVDFAGFAHAVSVRSQSNLAVIA
jgi:hypothetical protein